MGIWNSMQYGAGTGFLVRTNGNAISDEERSRIIVRRTQRTQQQQNLSMMNLQYTLLALFMAALCATTSLGAVIAPDAATGNGTGDHYCGTYMCFYITLDSNKQTATVTMVSSSEIGWIGLGFGETMVGPELNIMWLSPDDAGVVISRRKASTHALPHPLSNQTALTVLSPKGNANIPRAITINHGKNPYVKNNQLTISYTRPQVLPESTLSTSTTKFVWAYGAVSPNSTRCEAPFTKHYATGSFTLDLTKQLGNSTGNGTVPTATVTTPPTGTGTNPNSSSVTGTNIPDFDPPPAGLTNTDYMIIAHAVIMFCAWGVLIPLAIFVARFGRKMEKWVRKHWIIQVVAVVLTIIGVIIGFILTSPDPPTETHHILGIAIFIAVLFQFFLGWYIHYLHDKERTRSPPRTRRPTRNYMHIFFGTTLLILGYIQMPLGMTLYQLSSGWFYAYYIWLAIQVIIFLLLTWRQVKERRREKDQAEEELAGNADSLSSGSRSPVQQPEMAYNPDHTRA
ncbi:hypothetical protein BC936DRAFT_148405 [Jimgerdemannia flammicorona]|uniref:Cytochrome b561 domain-containing protein n=1 Tax=Jimgerdemannia flammicorona TaxID=994334 RepID=A0A433D395_9FUNG|nr:hypothetical protein BC936DRAFT_148405 [Jimgerdemannia flammicorona]